MVRTLSRLAAGVAIAAALIVPGVIAPALAADLPPTPRAPVLQAPSWSGFYVGAHVGGAFGWSDWYGTSPFPPLLDAGVNPGGVIGGVQAGYNYQFDRIVVGVEGDFDGTNYRDSAGGCFTDPGQSCSSRADWFATLTGRFGVTFGDALVFMKGGAAWSRFKYENPCATCLSTDYVGSASRVGWTAGVGVEYALMANWSARLEYDYLDFGTKNVLFAGTTPGDNFAEDIREQVHAFKLGVNYRFNAGAPAVAAPLIPLKAPPRDVAANWTGVYVGAHVGGAFADSDWTSSTPDAGVRPGGFLGGVQAGYNYQFDRFVVGIEGDVSGARVTGDATGCFADIGQTCQTRADWFATLAGRFGVTVGDALLFAKGGVAWGRFKYDNPCADGSVCPTLASFDDLTASATRTGWTVGAGFEYALAANWSAKLEYDYMDFGTKTVLFTGVLGPADTFSEDMRDRVHVVKAGLNYRFR